MLTTGAMVRLGKTFGNLMVDLRATNEKLRIRSRRIVRLLTHLDDDGAGRLLGRCDGEVKTAIVVGRLGLAVEEARQRLERHDGHLRAALTE
jgi:N-acetylmuramic acid 6-phosphate (MurNAc-6-P) etherase